MSSNKFSNALNVTIDARMEICDQSQFSVTVAVHSPHDSVVTLRSALKFSIFATQHSPVNDTNMCYKFSNSKNVSL